MCKSQLDHAHCYNHEVAGSCHFTYQKKEKEKKEEERLHHLTVGICF